MSTYREILNASWPSEIGAMKVTRVLALLQPVCRVACVPGAIFHHIFHSLLYMFHFLCNLRSVKISLRKCRQPALSFAINLTLIV